MRILVEARGAADVFLETERKDCCRVRSRGARAGGGAVFHDADVHKVGCGAFGVSDQAVSGCGGCMTIPGTRMPSQSAHIVGDSVPRGGTVPVRHAAGAGGNGAWSPAQARCIIG